MYIYATRTAEDIAEARKHVHVTNLTFHATGVDSRLTRKPGGWWSFTVQAGEDPTPRDYYTSNIGDGLWVETGHGMADDRQIAGFCQFDLAGCTRRQAYDRIRTYFAKRSI